VNRRRLPSPALIVAGLALFAALAGVGYAASNLGSKSVKSRHISKDAVKKRHLARDAVGKQALAKNAVTSGAVVNGSLRASDLASDAVPQQYAAYLLPQEGENRIDVGWSTASPTPTALTYVQAGRYRVEFSRTDGVGCAVPTATAYDADSAVGFRVISASCDGPSTSFVLQTSNNQDSQFFLSVTFSP
jgi:hypothetical protein